MSDRDADRKAEAVRLCGGTGHWMQHRDRQDECPMIERALAAAEDAGKNIGLELAAVTAENVRSGYTANIRVDESEQELVPDEDGPWVLNADVAEAIRVLKGKP